MSEQVDPTRANSPRRHRQSTSLAVRGVMLLCVLGVLGWAWFLLRPRVGGSEETAGADVAGPAVPDSARAAHYVGAQVCGKCHVQRFREFSRTAHHLTSRLPDSLSIAGSFEPERAILRTRNPNLWFEMSQREDGFYQTAVFQTPGGERRHSERIDFVIGSARLGQTYLYWKGRRLFQLPVSYLTAGDRWINSPGYRDGEADFFRPVAPRCLECHATYFEARSHTNNVFNREGYVLGISCERCHGPGSQHVAFHRANFDAEEAHYILHPGKLPRERLLEVCAQCHSGQGVLAYRPPFSFRPGKRLGDYILLEDFEKQNQLGVHSTNQLARLSQSRCFQSSPSMTCITCHNPHVVERGQRERFAERCETCHTPQACGMVAKVGQTLQSFCVDCHLPRQEDLGTGIETSGGFEFPRLHDHRIAVYPDVSRRVLARLPKERER